MTDPVPVADRINARPPWQVACATALAGGAMALGQAPFDLWPVALLGAAALLALVSGAPRPRTAAWRGWIGAAAYFAGSLHWIVEPFFVDAARDGWMAPFALGLLAGGLALFWAVPSWAAARIAPASRPAARAVLLVAGLGIAELLRAHVLTGFPWAHPGHVLIDTPALSVSAWLGPHGLTLVFVLAAAGIALAGWMRHGAALALALPLGLAMIWPTAEAPQPAADAPIVRLVQANAPQHLKWRPDMIPVFFQRGLDLTATPPEGLAPDLIVWPETSLPVLLGRSDAARARLMQAAGGARIVIGAQRFEGFNPRNTAALLTENGAIAQVYDKHHLVPFGEYVPFSAAADAMGLAGLAEVLGGGYRPGPGPALFDLGPGLGQAFPMICYEAIFPGYIRQVARPDWMVHLTNDAWFGAFSGPYQHLALARLRAAEQGLPVLRAANTGVSAVIDARGHVTAFLPLNTAGVLDTALPPAAPPTLYARFGDGPVLMCLILLLLAGWALRGHRAPLPS